MSEEIPTLEELDEKDRKERKRTYKATLAALQALAERLTQAGTARLKAISDEEWAEAERSSDNA